MVRRAVVASMITEPSCKPNYNTDYCKIVEDVYGGQHKGHVPLGLGVHNRFGKYYIGSIDSHQGDKSEDGNVVSANMSS